MDRRLAVLAAAAAAAFAPWTFPEARADRLGGNYRGPDDRCVVREDPAPSGELRAASDPLLSAFGLERPFAAGTEAGAGESRFRGRPLLVFFALRGCPTSASVAERALRDAEVLDLAGRFVAVVADAEREERFGVTHGVRTIPTILMLDAAGRELGRIEGAVDAPRAAAELRSGLRRAGPVRPSPEAKALERAASNLSRAVEAKDWRAVLAAAATIEKSGRDGPERDSARAAKSEAAREAGSRLDAARRRILVGGKEDPARVLSQIALDFEGLEEAVEAGELLRALAGSRTANRGAGSRLNGTVGPNSAVSGTISTNSLPRNPRLDVDIRSNPGIDLEESPVLRKPNEPPPPPPPPDPDP